MLMYSMYTLSNQRSMLWSWYLCTLLSVSAIRQNKPSFNTADTNALVAAVGFGKGLSKCRPPGPVAPGHPGQGPMMSGGPTLQQVTIGGGSGQHQGMGPGAPQQQGQAGMMRLNIIIWLCYTLKSCIHFKALNLGYIDFNNKGSWLLRHILYLVLD